MELGALRGCLSTLPHPKNLKRIDFGPDLCFSPDLCCCTAEVYALWRFRCEGAGEGAENAILRISQCFRMPKGAVVSHQRP
jgi:hypothetical protein